MLMLQHYTYQDQNPVYAKQLKNYQYSKKTYLGGIPLTEKEKKEEPVQIKLYDFMNADILDQMDKAVDFINYFTQVKQDVLIKLDSLNYSLANGQFKLKLLEADTLLNFNFKEEYGKDNEQIRKAHLQKENKELLEQIKDFKYEKSVLEHEVDAINDIIQANMMLLAEHDCKCGEQCEY
jgi:hypothetical protein